MCSTIKGEEPSFEAGGFISIIKDSPNVEILIEKWCPGLDLNQHASQRYHLKVVCLPFHHLGTEYGKSEPLS